ncbi:hypothetical protein [Novosphingobium sp. HII-3]|uniref:hypothetical protein n=1 Tax=Novosphingobium sp. HII-3 TaxID=2075565 RepID=UPI000CDB68D2|nr:hypothetical protein [Novosphingobium sp. HII-3]
MQAPVTQQWQAANPGLFYNHGAIMAAIPDVPVPAVLGIAKALNRAPKTDRKVENGKAIPAYWFPEGHIVELVMTGSEKAPGVRIMMGHRK